MTPDDEFDTYLTAQLEEAALSDHDFSRGVVARMAAHRRRRRLALAGAGVGASLVAAIALVLSPASAPAFPAMTPEGIVATLLLVALCSLVWIGTASSPCVRQSFTRRTL
jgi:hypothetical protein